MERPCSYCLGRRLAHHPTPGATRLHFEHDRLPVDGKRTVAPPEEEEAGARQIHSPISYTRERETYFLELAKTARWRIKCRRLEEEKERQRHEENRREWKRESWELHEEPIWTRRAKPRTGSTPR